MAIAESILKYVVPVKDMPDFEVRAYTTKEDKSELISKWTLCCSTYKKAADKIFYEEDTLSERIIVEKFNDRQDSMVQIIRININDKGLIWSLVNPDPKIAMKLVDMPDAFSMAVQCNPTAVKKFPKEIRDLDIMGEIFLNGHLVCNLNSLTEKFRDDAVFMNKAYQHALTLEVSEFGLPIVPVSAVIRDLGPNLKQRMEDEIFANGNKPTEEILAILSEQKGYINAIKKDQKKESTPIKKLFFK